MLSPFKHGFGENRSATTYLLDISNYEVSRIKNGAQVDFVLLDLSLALDRINHAVYLAMMTSIGFPAVFISCIVPYWTVRTQSLVYCDAVS